MSVFFIFTFFEQHLSGHQSVHVSSNKQAASQKKEGGLHGGGNYESNDNQELSIQVAMVDPLVKAKTDVLKTL